MRRSCRPRLASRPATWDIHSAADPYYLCCYAGVYAPRDIKDEQWSNIQKEKTYTAYAMLNFALDDLRVDGNAGVRVVRTENTAKGYVVFPNVAYARTWALARQCR